MNDAEEYRNGASKLAQNCLGVAAALLLWHVFSSEAFLPSEISRGFTPASTAQALGGFLAGDEFLRHTLPSLKRAAIGLALAFIVGVPLGIVVGQFKVADRLTCIPFQFIRMTSPLAWMPVAIMLFGIGDRPIYFLIAIAALWPIMLNTAHGVLHADPTWINVVRSLGGSRWEVLKQAILPATVPHTITGFRIALGLCWVILVPAEMLGVSSGLGYYILDTRDRFDYGELLAVVLVIGFLGYMLDLAARVLEQKVAQRI